MTLLIRLWHQFWTELRHQNQTVTAYHEQQNKQQLPPTPRRGAPKGYKK